MNSIFQNKIEEIDKKIIIGILSKNPKKIIEKIETNGIKYRNCGINEISICDTAMVSGNHSKNHHRNYKFKNPILFTKG